MRSSIQKEHKQSSSTTDTQESIKGQYSLEDNIELLSEKRYGI